MSDGAFEDPFLLTITLVMTLLLLFGNIYFIAYYSHYADSFFGSSTACKAVLVVGYMLAQGQILMLPLDVQNTREGTNFVMYMMWYLIVMSSLFYIVLVLPFGLFYSETDEEKEFKWRICSAFKNEVILLVISSIIIFPMYVAMSYSYFPITVNQCEAATAFVGANVVIGPDQTYSNCVQTDTTMEVRVGFQIFMLTVMTFIGWCLFCIFLPTGMQAIPFDLAVEWIYRPRPMDTEQFNKEKDRLAKNVQILLRDGKELINKKKDFAHDNRGAWMCQRWRRKSSIRAEQHLFEKHCMLAEQEFQKLDKIAEYKKNVEPIKYALKLVLAIFVAAISVLLVVHTFAYVALKVDGKEIEPFLNDMLEKIETSPLGFLATVFLVATGFFLMVCALRGNVKLGLRFFFVNFYPVVPKETFVNAFMANCLVMNLWMTALIFYMNVIFRGYLRGTESAKIFQVQVRNMMFFKWFFQGNFFIIWTLVWWWIALIYLILKPTDKLKLDRDIKTKDLSAKQ